MSVPAPQTRASIYASSGSAFSEGMKESPAPVHFGIANVEDVDSEEGSETVSPEVRHLPGGSGPALSATPLPGSVDADDEATVAAQQQSSVSPSPSPRRGTRLVSVVIPSGARGCDASDEKRRQQQRPLGAGAAGAVGASSSSSSSTTRQKRERGSSVDTLVSHSSSSSTHRSAAVSGTAVQKVALSILLRGTAYDKSGSEGGGRGDAADNHSSDSSSDDDADDDHANEQSALMSASSTEDKQMRKARAESLCEDVKLLMDLHKMTTSGELIETLQRTRKKLDKRLLKATAKSSSKLARQRAERTNPGSPRLGSPQRGSRSFADSMRRKRSDNSLAASSSDVASHRRSAAEKEATPSQSTSGKPSPLVPMSNPAAGQPSAGDEASRNQENGASQQQQPVAGVDDAEDPETLPSVASAESDGGASQAHSEHSEFFTFRMLSTWKYALQRARERAEAEGRKAHRDRYNGTIFSEEPILVDDHAEYVIPSGKYATEAQREEDAAIAKYRKLNLFFDFFMVLLMAYEFCSVVFRAFFEIPHDTTSYVVDLLLVEVPLILYALSNVVKLREEKGIWKFNWRNSAREYLYSVDFLLDLGGIFPLEAVGRGLGYHCTNHVHACGFVAPYWQLNRLLLTRGVFVKFEAWLETVTFNIGIHPSIGRVFQQSMRIMLFCHSVACFVNIIMASDPPLAAQWMRDPGYFNRTLSSKYFVGMDWSTKTLVGFAKGDPFNIPDKCIAFMLVCSMIGLGFLSVFIGSVTSYMNRQTALSAALQKIDEVIDDCHHRGLPNEFALQVIDFHWHRYRTTRHSDDVMVVLEELPKALQIRMLSHIGVEMVKHVPLLTPYASDQSFVMCLMMSLVPVVLMPYTTYFKKGDRGNSMAFITWGTMGVVPIDFAPFVAGKDTVLFTLRRGMIIGEIALILGLRRTATVTSLDEYANLMELRKDNFVQLQHDFPEVIARMQQQAMERVGQLQQKSKDALQQRVESLSESSNIVRLFNAFKDWYDHVVEKMDARLVAEAAERGEESIRTLQNSRRKSFVHLSVADIPGRRWSSADTEGGHRGSSGGGDGGGGHNNGNNANDGHPTMMSGNGSFNVQLSDHHAFINGLDVSMPVTSMEATSGPPHVVEMSEVVPFTSSHNSVASTPLAADRPRRRNTAAAPVVLHEAVAADSAPRRRAQTQVGNSGSSAPANGRDDGGIAEVVEAHHWDEAPQPRGSGDGGDHSMSTAPPRQASPGAPYRSHWTLFEEGGGSHDQQQLCSLPHSPGASAGYEGSDGSDQELLQRPMSAATDIPVSRRHLAGTPP